MHGGHVAARTFVDSAGTLWEVFEVQRSSQKAQAVSAGLELGWLAFVSDTSKRRLAPFPMEWRTADAAELERLCGMARAARHSGMALLSPTSADGKAGTAGSGARARIRVPRIRTARMEAGTSDGSAIGAAGSGGELPIVASATSADSVESTVREFAHQARAGRVPAIEAMVRLKALLMRVYPDAGSAARDLRAVRRWFVEAYYFDRDAVRTDAPDRLR